MKQNDLETPALYKHTFTMFRYPIFSLRAVCVLVLCPWMWWLSARERACGLTQPLCQCPQQNIQAPATCPSLPAGTFWVYTSKQMCPLTKEPKKRPRIPRTRSNSSGSFRAQVHPLALLIPHHVGHGRAWESQGKDQGSSCLDPRAQLLSETGFASRKGARATEGITLLRPPKRGKAAP